MRTKSFILIIILIIITIRAQQISSVWYDTENGLPQNSVKDIIQDKYGFIWISTENGLVKYDGNLFQIKKNLAQSNNRYSNFRGNKDNDSIYNVTSYQEDIIIISGMKAKRESLSKYVMTMNINNNIYYDYSRNGYISVFFNTNYFIKTKQYIYYLDKSAIYSQHLQNNRKLLLPKIWKGYIEDIFGVNDCIYIVSKKEKKILKILNDKISYVPGASILFENDAKIYWSKVNNQTFLIKDNTLYKVFLTDKGFDVKKIISYNFTKMPITSIFYDENFQMIILGTVTNGLNILRINNFKVIQKNNHENIYYALLPLENNRFLSATGDIFSNNAFLEKLNLNKASNYFLQKDKFQNIYTINDFGISVFYKKDNYKESKTITLYKPPITYFYQTENFSFVATTDETGFKNSLSIFNKNNKTQVAKYFFNSIVNIIKPISEVELLVGTRKGLYKINLNNYKYEKIKYPKNIQIRDIIRTKDGYLWVMTYGDGFFLYQNSQLIKMPMDYMGRLSSAHSLQEDNNGNFWISSNSGLFKVRKNSLLDYSKSQKAKVYYYRYTKDDGFLTNEFNGGCSPSSLSLDNGNLVFPSMKGIVLFNPLEIKSFYPKNFYIKTIRFSENESQLKKDSLILANNFYKAEVYVDVPYYANAENLILEAKIENSKSNKWEKLNSRKYLIMGLEPGNYKLRIRALASDKGDYLYKTINISVKYLFYQTFFFRFLLVLFILGLVLLIIKVKIRQQQLKNIVLEKIIESRTEKLSETVKALEITKERLRNETQQQKKLLETISHDVITPAKYLSITTKKLCETEEKDYHQVKKYFEVLHKSSEEFYNFIKTLKDYAEIYKQNNHENDEIFLLNEIVAAKIMLFKEIAMSNNTNINHHIKYQVEINSNKNIISIVIHNIIDNAVKNTLNGSIDIFVEKTQKGTIIIIRDSGNGMTIEQMKYYNEIIQNNDRAKLILQKYGLGLHLVVQLLTMINGEINFSQNLPKGTITTITIKNKLNE